MRMPCVERTSPAAGEPRPGKVVDALRVADNLNPRPVKHDPGDGDFALQGMNPEIHLDVGGLEEMTGAEGGILGDGRIVGSGRRCRLEI